MIVRSYVFISDTQGTGGVVETTGMTEQELTDTITDLKELYPNASLVYNKESYHEFRGTDHSYATKPCVIEKIN